MKLSLGLGLSALIKTQGAIIIQCIASFQIISPYLSGALSNANKTTTINGPIGNYANAWGKQIQYDSNRYALECNIFPSAFIPSVDFPIMGMVDMVTGEFAGFKFTGSAMEIVNFDGTVNNTFTPFGTPSQIGFTYQWNTGEFSFYFKVDASNPEARSNIAPITTPNPVRFVIGGLNNSGLFDFTYSINNGPSEFQIVYPNGVVSACGQSFTDLDFMSNSALAEPFYLSNNNRTLTTNSGSAGSNYIGVLNQISSTVDGAKTMEFEITSITNVGNNVITFGISDTMTDTVCAIAIQDGNISWGNNDQSGLIPLPFTYSMQVGDVFGLTINRWNIFNSISNVAEFYIKTASGFVGKYEIQASYSPNDLYGVMFISNATVADVMSITHHNNYDEMIGTYPVGALDFSGDPTRPAPNTPVFGGVWNDANNWDDTQIWYD